MKKIAFYPCCASDFIDSIDILKNYTNEILFCDTSENSYIDFKRFSLRYNNELKISYLSMDAKIAISEIINLDILFYRRDSGGEGGSAQYILGDEYLKIILPKFPNNGGLIITDGSNSRGGNYRKMKSIKGVVKHGYCIKLTKSQPYKDNGLFIFSVDKDIV